MNKLVIGLALIFVASSSMGAVIPLKSVDNSSSGNCTDLTSKPVNPYQCSIFAFISTTDLVNRGDTFNVSCTFGAGQNNPNGLIPGDVLAIVYAPTQITSGPLIPPNQPTLINTQGVSSVKFSWTGRTDADAIGDVFGIYFDSPNLQNGQTIKVSCVNN
jgi:hypothetical protein